MKSYFDVDWFERIDNFFVFYVLNTFWNKPPDFKVLSFQYDAEIYILTLLNELLLRMVDLQLRIIQTRLIRTTV